MIGIGAHLRHKFCLSSKHKVNDFHYCKIYFRETKKFLDKPRH